MTQSRRVSYRRGLFDPATLSNHQSIRDSLAEFSAAINESNATHALNDLLDKSKVVELVLSGLCPEIPLQDWIIEQFPSFGKSFDQTFHYKLLSTLADLFVIHSTPGEELACQQYHQTIKHAPAVIQQLYIAASLGDSATVRHDTKKPTSQREKKQEKKFKQKLAFDEKIFKLIDIIVPLTSSESQVVANSFMDRMKSILEFYLIKIQSSEIFDAIEASFIPQERPAELRITTDAPMVITEAPPPAPISEEAASVFPMVQPLKSAMYFDSPEDFGKWRILVSSDADRALRRYHRGDKTTFDIVVSKIKDLSRGHFSADNNKKLSGPDNMQVPVYEAKMTGNLRLVYQIDCIPDYDINIETQVIRLFGVYKHNEMDKNRLWAHVSSQLSTRGKEYRKRCLTRNAEGLDIYGPASFPPVIEHEEVVNPTLPDIPADESDELHKILTLEKYVTLSKELLDSIEADRDATFPFEVSKFERTIIQHPTSCYVLGRSGTGKTTTMLHKMIWVERAYQVDATHSMQKPQKPRQVFVTQSHVLAKKVDQLFNTYLASIVNCPTTSCKPEKFSELEDKHFPLFVTVDQLYSMLEADVQDVEIRSQTSAADVFWLSSLAPSDHGFAKGKLVTYDRFLGEYWPHFDQALKKGLHPALVFKEIIGVIMGSEGAAISSEGYLDRQAYEKLSHRAQSTFVDCRPSLYGLFEAYRKLKSQLRDFDPADRAHKILHTLTKQPLNGQKFHHLYVDESQDNLLLDSLVLRILCMNPNGLFWAGDTAQTISSGSSFRFQDLTALLHRFEKQRRAVSSGTAIPIKPKMFHLSVNYRSHSGIVNCAHAVIGLISKYFPYTIDTLPRERGMTNGPLPIFYQDVYPGFLRQGRFLSPNSASDEKIELGAHQCILVRDEAAKERLQDELGDIGIIATVYDSKGLEFNDVFLYNFFQDSPIDVSQWRMVLNGLEYDTHTAPDFNPIRHAAVCSELKALYVAITRARNNVRIADESLKGEPMRIFWTSRQEIRSCYPDEELVDFAVTSTKEEWAERAREFLQSEKFLLARNSFQKAQELLWAAYANSHHLRQVAIRTPNTQTRDKTYNRQGAFRSAGNAFMSSARSFPDALVSQECYGLAAECFEEAGEILGAAKAYKSAANYMRSALLFRQLGKFNEVHDLILNYGQLFKPEHLEKIRDIVRMYYVSRKNFNKVHQLFNTVEEELEYLDERNLDMAKLDLLLSRKRHREAASLHFKEGRYLDAFSLFFEEAKIDKASMSAAKDCILKGLWQTLSFSADVKAKSVEAMANNYLESLDSLEPGTLSHSELNEVEMFRAILLAEYDHLLELSRSFRRDKNTNAVLLCLDQYFTNCPTSLDADIANLATWLQDFFEYVRILHDLAFFVDPATNTRVWALFGIRYVEERHQFFAHPGSFFHAFLSSTARADYLHIALSKEEFTAAFRQCLQDRLLERVAQENMLCRQARGLDPCLRHITLGDCDPIQCTRQHIAPDESWVRHWIMAHLLQVLIYDSVSQIAARADSTQINRRFWIRKLHEVLNPPHHALEAFSHLEAHVPVDIRTRAISALVNWCRETSFYLQYYPALPFLSILLQTGDTVFTFDKKEASQYMYFAQPVSSRPPLCHFRDRKHSLQELMVAFDVKGPSAILIGTLFIRHVVENRLYVDINVFCSFIEKICSYLIVFNHYKWAKEFHRILLPRSWLHRVLCQFNAADTLCQEVSRFWLLLQPLAMLLKALYFRHDSDYLLVGYELKSITRTGSMIRSIYIARICRVLGLLGINIRVKKFRGYIYDHITSLRSGAHHGFFSRLYSRYVNSGSFQEIEKVTQRSMRGSSLDEMVQLLDFEQQKGPVTEVLGLRRLIYKKEEDLLGLLIDTKPIDNAQAVYLEEPSMPTPTNIFEHLSVDEVDALEVVPDLAEADEEVILNDSLGDEDEYFIPETEIPSDIRISHSEQELEAASNLQQMCRVAISQKILSQDPSVEGGTYRYFQICNKEAQPMNTSYRLRYLCFIPPLLASLDILQNLVLVKRADMARKLSSGKIAHGDLDQFCSVQSRIRSVLKAIERVQQTLRPNSKFYQTSDISELEKHLQEALDMFRDVHLPLEIPEPVKAKMEIIRVGIMPHTHFQGGDQHCTTEKRKKRPLLNWDESEDDGTNENSPI